jgi:myo-inositol-1(or 4)-monophosphatase
VLAFERVAHTAAARAGGLIRARYRERPEISYKSEIDLVTAIDREAERLIVETILEAFPDHGIIAEESAPREGKRDYRWYVDPLDGTTNFAHGFPHFAVSIALAHAEEVVLALVYDPVREETFTALRAGGARLNGAPIRVSETATLGRSLVASGFPYDHRERVDAYLAVWREALRRAQGVRRAGSAALDLCYVAAGRFDGFWEAKLHAWDVAAGRLIVEEAGGRVTDFRGAAHRLSAEETVASNGHIHRELLDMIAAASLDVSNPASPPRT